MNAQEARDAFEQTKRELSEFDRVLNRAISEGHNVFVVYLTDKEAEQVRTRGFSLKASHDADLDILHSLGQLMDTQSYFVKF